MKKNTSQQREVQRVKQDKRLLVVRIMDCIIAWKRRLDKVKKRKLYRYGKNVQNTLNLTVKEEFRPNEDHVEDHVFEDNIALESQVKLVSYKPMGTTSTTAQSNHFDDGYSTFTDSNSKRKSRNGGDKQSRDTTESFNKRSSNDVTSTDSHSMCGSETCTLCCDGVKRRKPIKRIRSHSAEFKDVYKKINWQEWTMAEGTSQQQQKQKIHKRPLSHAKQPKRIAEEEEVGRSKNTFLSTHRDMTFERLSRLYFDFDSESDDSENMNNNVPPGRDYYANQDRDTFMSHFSYQKPRSSLTGSMGSNRGSLHSNSGSIRSNPASPVPMNFIPGQLKPMTSKEREAKVPFGDIQKAIFCFKGITCRVEKTQPRTAKAVVHTGMMFISMSAPSAHKCSY